MQHATMPVYFRGFGLFLVDPPNPLVVIPPKIRHNILLVMPSNSACKSFQTSWIDKFGVKIASRDCTTNEVVSVKCLFCEKYGKEEEDNGADAKGQKRKQTTNVKYF
jgi:hypothetical protein